LTPFSREVIIDGVESTNTDTDLVRYFDRKVGQVARWITIVQIEQDLGVGALENVHYSVLIDWVQNRLYTQIGGEKYGRNALAFYLEWYALGTLSRLAGVQS
tara:strand:+ start:316 stop:621 length:306 start_codon:yes stop_codon:yes gene_type:complete